MPRPENHENHQSEVCGPKAPRARTSSFFQAWSPRRRARPKHGILGSVSAAVGSMPGEGGCLATAALSAHGLAPT
eukprot:5744175-Alexandrium_andersonii.AAC.1